MSSVRLAAMTLAVGLTLSVLLLGASERYGGIVPGEWWIALVGASSGVLGGWSAMTIRTWLALPGGGAAAVLSIATVLAIKAVRWPEAPVVGDGFVPLVAMYGYAGVLGAALALPVARRAGPAVGRWLAATGFGGLAGLVIAFSAVSILPLFVGS
jgi:hypothetical protein